MNFKEAMKEFNCEQMWDDFVHEINMPLDMFDFKTFESKKAWAGIFCKTLIGHLCVQKEYYERLLDSYLSDITWSTNKLGIQAEIAAELMETRKQLSAKTPISGKPNSIERERTVRSIGRLETMMELFEESKEHKERQNRFGQALTVFNKVLSDAERTIEKRVFAIAETYDFTDTLEGFGQQYGADYFHKKGQPYYSGPQNPPQRPTASPLIPGYIEDPGTERCWCAWCEEIIPKPASTTGGLSKCEDFAHKCKDGEMRMLTTCIKMGGDKRPSTADLAKAKHHPHSGDKA